MDLLNRRAFLARLGLLFGSSVAAELARFEGADWGSARSQNSEHGLGNLPGYALPEFGNFKGTNYLIAPWTGDDFRQGHQLRDASLPQTKIEEEKSVDFVIVGGGVAGLSAAHYLRHHDFLLLEQYPELGGQSRGGSHKGLDYSYGPAFVGTPEGIVADLFGELNLKPVKLESSRNAWHLDGNKTFDGVTSKEDSGVYAEFRKFEEQAAPIWKAIAQESDGCLIRDNSLQALDKTLFSSCLSNYSPTFQGILDTIARGYNCIGLDKISALAAYSIFEDLFEPCYAFEGGNTAIPKSIVSSFRADGSDRLKRGSFVWSVEITDGGAIVVYSDSNGHLHRIHAKHVIFTAPLLVAARVIKNMDNVAKAQMLSFRYGSYLVANCMFSKPVYTGAFDNWYSPSSGFSDIIVAETVYKKLGKYAANMGQVLTLYQPYVPGSEGRSLLLEGDKTKVSGEMLEQLSSRSNNLEASLESVVLSRWGHAMPVTNVGYYSRMSKIMSLPLTSVSLANNCTQGIPCAESAIAAARKASNEALKIKTKAKAIFSPPPFLRY